MDWTGAHEEFELGPGERKVGVRCEVGRVDDHLWMEGDDYRSCRGGALFSRSGESGGGTERTGKGVGRTMKLVLNNAVRVWEWLVLRRNRIARVK